MAFFPTLFSKMGQAAAYQCFVLLVGLRPETLFQRVRFIPQPYLASAVLQTAQMARFMQGWQASTSMAAAGRAESVQ